ncbi:ATP-binding cassette transporter snq2, partial [Coemansia sp. RSA 1933]
MLSIPALLPNGQFAILASTLFITSFYGTISLNSITDCVSYFYFTYIILGIFSLTLGQAIASFAPNEIVAAMFNPIFTAMIMLFCGLSPYMYYVKGVITNDLHGSKVVCRSDEYFTTLNWSFTHRWRNVGIMFGYIVFNIAFTALMIKIYKVN